MSRWVKLLIVYQIALVGALFLFPYFDFASEASVVSLPVETAVVKAPESEISMTPVSVVPEAKVETQMAPPPPVETQFTLEEPVKVVAPVKPRNRLALPSVDERGQLEHRAELLGKYRSRKFAHALMDITPSQMSQMILDIVKAKLPKKYAKKSAKIARTLVQAASEHDMDPFFLIAVIQQESSFNPDAVGGVGELGLMQIRPGTGAWMAKILGMKKLNLRDPVQNIKIGAALFERLREDFDNQSRSYISAYNMGPAKLRTRLSQKKLPKEYASKVMKHYISMYTTIAVANR